MLDYLYDLEAEQYSFVRVPKILLQHEIYQRITPEAKLLYSLLLDRVGISLRNGWKDKQGRIYIIYPIAEIMEEMNCGKNKAVQLLDELENKVGLIERKRQGLGKPNLIYVRSFFRTVDNSGERHFLKFENKTSGNPKTKPTEVSESNSNNTDSNKTYKNHTDLSFLPGSEAKGIDDYERSTLVRLRNWKRKWKKLSGGLKTSSSVGRIRRLRNTAKSGWKCKLRIFVQALSGDIHTRSENTLSHRLGICICQM